MTLSEINEVAAERRAIRELLGRWKAARWRPVEADKISEQIASIVESPLALGPSELLSAIWVAPVISEGLAFFSSDTGAFVRPHEWPNGVRCYDLRNLHAGYRSRLDALVIPFEHLLVEAA
jgi:hypothetical protein